MNLIYFVAFLTLGLNSAVNPLSLLQPSDLPPVKTNSTSVTLVKSLIGNPNEFISQVASLDPKKLDEIIVLLEKLVTVSLAREETLLDTLTAKNAANQLAEDNVITAGTNLDTAKTAVATAKTTLTAKETAQTTAQTTLDAAKLTQTDKKKEQDTAQKAYDDEKPSLDDEQKMLRDVITILRNLRGIRSDEVISLMRDGKYVTCPNGKDCRLTNSFSIDSKLMFRKGYEQAAYNTGNTNGADSSSLVDGDAAILKLGTLLTWKWVLDCAHGSCTYQNHEGTEGGHWGSPNKIHKANNLQTNFINIGDLIWFAQMVDGWNGWNNNVNIDCDSTKCYKAGGKPEFLVCDDSGYCGV